MALNLAVASDGPTRRRLYQHLPPYGIAVHHLPVGRTCYQLGAVDHQFDIDYDVGFVFPKRMIEGSVITAELGLSWVNDHDDIATTRNKAGVLARLATVGIPTPRTVHVSSPSDREAIVDAFDRLDAPVVIKPNTTTRGVGHVRVDDPDSFEGVVDYLELIHAFPATEDRSFLIQEYIPEARDVRLTVIDGSVAGAVERSRPEGDDGWVRNVHRGATPVSIRPSTRLVELAELVADELEVALLGVDILLGPAGPVVLEVNGRPTIDRVDQYPSDFYDRLAALIRKMAAAGED